MLVAAAFVPIPPLLVPAIAAGSATADAPLRTACREAVTRLVTAEPDEIVVVGPGETTGPAQGSWDWRGFGVAVPDPAPAARLPHGLAIGSWLLDTCAAPVRAHRFHAVHPDTSPRDCAALGRELVAGDRRIGLLVCGDGSACRTEKAPGHFDLAAEAWDEAALDALQSADGTGLLRLDAAIGRRLMAAGRAPWQVLAGAAADGTFEATVDWADAPYGVMYIVGSWTRGEALAR
jgi:hypothetical protein